LKVLDGTIALYEPKPKRFTYENFKLMLYVIPVMMTLVIYQYVWRDL